MIMKYEIKNNEITELTVKKSNRRKKIRICLAFAAAGILIFLFADRSARQMIQMAVNESADAINVMMNEDAAVAGRRVSVAQADADPAEKLPEPPGVSARGAVLIEGVSGRILYDKNKDIRMYPASTTKIMTALLAVESAEDAEIVETPESETEEFLKRKVRVADEAVGAEGSSIYLKKGESVSLEDLLYGMMLRSGNDAALAAAIDIGGTVEDFTNMMNKRAVSLGMKNTHFCNPNGLHDEKHVSTAYDMALLAREAMKHDLFRQIAGAKVWNASRDGADNYNYFYNKNKTVFQYEGATGIKIGYTKAAGRCLVASAQKNGMELIAVVLDDQNWFQDVYALFDYGYARYNNVKICDAEKLLTRVNIKDGAGRGYARVGTRDAVYCPSHKCEKTDISIEYDLPKTADAPVSRWEQAGRMRIYSGGEYIYDVPLYYMEDVDRAPAHD